MCHCCLYLQVSRELAVLLDGLLVIGYSLLRSFDTFLGLSDSRTAQIQHLSQLQLRLSGVLLQLVVHLVYGFLKGGDSDQHTGSVPRWTPSMTTIEISNDDVSRFWKNVFLLHRWRLPEVWVPVGGAAVVVVHSNFPTLPLFIANKCLCQKCKIFLPLDVFISGKAYLNLTLIFLYHMTTMSRETVAVFLLYCKSH